MTWTYTPALPTEDRKVIFTLTDGITEKDYQGYFSWSREFIYLGNNKKFSPSVVLRWRYDV